MHLIRTMGKRPELGVLISLGVVWLVFVFLSRGKFAGLGNVAALLAQSAELGIVTVGVAFTLICGEIDLSVGSVYGLSGLLFVLLADKLGSVPAFVIALGIACTAGLVNGLVTTRTMVPSLIVTLGMSMFLRGLIYFTTGGFTRTFTELDFFINALGGPLGGGFNISIVWFLLIVVIFTVILRMTQYGNFVMAVGGNKEVARAMGIEVNQVKLITFVLCAGLAGLAGMISASRFRSVAATTGTTTALEAIAAAVMGGCLVTGGYGTIPGAALGAVLIPAVGAGLVMSGAPAYWYQAFIGVVLVAAAVLNLVVHRRTIGQ
ncbi:MAG: ABC transporter permease [Anaerolineae bacterium]|nr:ABC transporter permease [Anaerolineae bacterium]MDW8070929.1 ABC transporter permease [Anaerolineae bacterium]